MKKHSIVFLLFFIAHASLAQTFFEYDPAGNRIRRFSIPVSDLVAQVQIGPSTTYGVTPVIAKLRVTEVNGVATSGPIVVRLTRSSIVTFSFDPTITSIGGTTVLNGNWNFDSTNPSYYTLTSSAVIPGANSSIIGLSGTVTPNNFQGLLTTTMAIIGGSGGELKATNNTGAAKLEYFPQ